MLALIAGLVVVELLAYKTTNLPRYVVSIVGYSLVLGVILIAQLTQRDLGLETSKAKAGVRFALPLVAAIIGVISIVYFISPEILRDSRYNLGWSHAVVYAFLIIPLRTVIMEELIFRGILFGILRRTLSARATLVGSALGFGLWHVLSAGSISVAGESSLPRPVLMLAVVVATSIFGYLLAWYRQKSGSLFAPILLHWSINASAVVYATLAWHS